MTITAIEASCFHGMIASFYVIAELCGASAYRYQERRNEVHKIYSSTLMVESIKGTRMKNLIFVCLLFMPLLSQASDRQISKLKLACEMGNEKACQKIQGRNIEATAPLKLLPKNSNQNFNQVKNKKTIVVTGYGNNKNQALNNAFKSAIEQYVGVVVSSDTMIKNGKLIKDEILTASNGYIETYKKLSEKNDDGLVEVKIKALVKSQKVYKKIKNLHIPTLTVYGGESAYSRITNKPVNTTSNDYSIQNEPIALATANKSKADIENILRKKLGDFFSPKSIKEMLVINIDSMKIYEDKAENGKVPVKVSYTLSIDNNIYNQKIVQLETIFKNLGGEYHSRVDMPKMISRNQWYSSFLVSNRNNVNKLNLNSLGIFKKYGSGYKLDVWTFPKGWKSIYPFNIDSSIKLKKKINMQLVFRDKGKEVIYGETITPISKEYNQKLQYLLLTHMPVLPIKYAFTTYSMYGYGNMEETVKVLAPFFSPYSSQLLNKTKCVYKQTINIEDVKKIKSVSVEIDEI